MAQHRVNPFLLEPGNECFLVIRIGENRKDGAFRHFGEFPVFNLLFGTGKLPLYGFIAGSLPEERRLERVAHLVPCIIGGRINQPMILPSAYIAPRFLHRHIIQGKEGTVFTHRLETVLGVQRLDRVPYLLLHIACRSVHLVQRCIKTTVPAFRIVKPVLLFQLTCNLLAAVEIVSGVDAPAVFVHPDRHDMQVVAVDVLVFEHKIRLVAVAHLFQILACDVLKLRVGQHILRVRVERYMHHRFLHPRLCGHEG